MLEVQHKSKALGLAGLLVLISLLLTPSSLNRLPQVPDSDALLMSGIGQPRVSMTLAEVRRFLRSRLKQTPAAEADNIARTLVQLCEKYKLNPKFILGVIFIESSFDSFAVSPKGAMGLLQLMPDTAQWVAQRLSLPWENPVYLFDPIYNLRLGVGYLAMLKNRYGEDMKAVLSAYNAGPGNFERGRESGKGYRMHYYRNVRSFVVSDAKEGRWGL